MSFSINRLKELLSIDSLNKHLDEIEEYLDVKSVEINSALSNRNINKPKRHAKVDSNWVVKTASAKLKRSIRKASKHM